jgi:hypothetical protein
MSPIGSRHVDRHGKLTAYLVEALGGSAYLLPQGSFPMGPV